jgi:hypothetical protein
MSDLLSVLFNQSAATPGLPQVKLVVGQHEADLTPVVAKLLASGSVKSLSISDAACLAPVIPDLLPYAAQIKALFSKPAVVTQPAPPVVIFPSTPSTPTPPPQDIPTPGGSVPPAFPLGSGRHYLPGTLVEPPAVAMVKMRAVVRDLGSSWIDGIEDKHSYLQKILDGVYGAPFDVWMLFSADPLPRATDSIGTGGIYPVPLGKFRWHFVVKDGDGRVKADFSAIGPDKYDGDPAYIKCVPRRFVNQETGEVSMWDCMAKFVGNTGKGLVLTRKVQPWSVAVRCEYPEAGLNSEWMEFEWQFKALEDYNKARGLPEDAPLNG